MSAQKSQRQPIRATPITWEELEELIILGEITQDDAERIMASQQQKRGGRENKMKCAGCDCDLVDSEIAVYRENTNKQQTSSAEKKRSRPRKR